ncbi:hypothetical protein Kisp02_67930 [Kineosporia sp. NBRC 101731]|nr:hypothetical protein Kisp02_67930 [Kineosporia sp. NBRC 101731]
MAAYSRPGDLVLDPMCGVCTTLVEAVHQGRDAIGIDLEAPFTSIARANLCLSAKQQASGTDRVFTGDATRMLDLLPPAWARHPRHQEDRDTESRRQACQARSP